MIDYIICLDVFQAKHLVIYYRGHWNQVLAANQCRHAFNNIIQVLIQ